MTFHLAVCVTQSYFLWTIMYNICSFLVVVGAFSLSVCVLLEWHHVCTLKTCDMNPSVPMQMIWPGSLIQTHFNTRRQTRAQTLEINCLSLLVRVPSILHSLPAPSSIGGRGLSASFYHVFNGVASQRKEEKRLADLSKFWAHAPCARSCAKGPFCVRVSVFLRERHSGKFTLSFH